MFLYATRPVLPWHYATGKLAAVFVPTFGLFLLPGLAVLGLRLGLLESVGVGPSLLLAAAVVGAAFLLSFGFSGVAVGASALTKRSRWAIVLTMALAFLPDAAMGLLLHGDAFPVGVVFASERLVTGLFIPGAPARAVQAAFVLGGWGALGWVVTAFKVGGEMTP